MEQIASIKYLRERGGIKLNFIIHLCQHFLPLNVRNIEVKSEEKHVQDKEKS